MNENTLLWKTKVGSHLFSANHAGSDYDMVEVYAIPTKDLLRGVNHGGGSHERHELHADGTPQDIQSHEAAKLVNEYLKGNINFMLAVWSPLVEEEALTMDANFDGSYRRKQSWLGTFRHIARANMAKNVLHSSVGIAHHMVADGHKGVFTEQEMQKKYRLALRILYFAGNWMLGLGPMFFPVPADVKRTEQDLLEVIAEVEKIHDLSALPETPNPEPFRDWLYNVRMTFL
jgi:predicted nucleotidyltransferase